MELTDESPSPPGKTPKTLLTQSARSLASMLIDATLPAVNRLWAGEVAPKHLVIKERQKKPPKKRNIIKHLQNVQQWYQNDDCLSSTGLQIRQLIGYAISEAVTFLIGDDDYSLMMMLTLQIMFCREAGFFGKSSVIYDARTSKSFGEFLQFLAPFDLETLYTTNINFQNPLPVVTMIRNSPFLRHVHIYKNLSDYVLYQLSKHCKNLETITVGGHNVVSEEYLFKAFFCGMNKKEVVRNVKCKEKVKLSFPNLKTVKVLIDLDKDGIMFFLQHFYPHIQIHWTRYVSENRLTPSMLRVILGPPHCLRGEGKFYHDVLDLTVKKNTLEKWTVGYPSLEFPVVRHLCISLDFHTWEQREEVSEKIRDIMERVKCTAFSHCSPDDDNWESVRICIPALESFGYRLTELHLNTFMVLDVKVLFSCLNCCPNLSTFSLSASKLEVSSGGPAEGLISLKQLCALDLNVHTLTSSDGACLAKLIFSAPKLSRVKLYGANAKAVVQDLAQLGVLSKIQVLSLHKSTWFDGYDIEYCKFLGENLPSVSVLIFNRMLLRTLLDVKGYFSQSQLRVIHRCNMLAE